MPDTLSPEVEALVSKIKEAITTSGVPLADAQKALSSVSGYQESAAIETTGLKLIESAGGFTTDIPLTEASRSNYPIKLISPGTGTMAHYPAAVLERDGPKVFKKGTLMFWNHPTKAEESARPEGDLNNLAAITTSDARWDANGVKGPGLYAEAKVMADYAQKIEERAPHIGLSIRAGGTGTGKLVAGKPELKTIDYAESVDYVTKAGRGGLALAEAARDAGILPEENEMTEAEIKKLVEGAVTTAVQAAVAAVQAPVKLLEARAVQGDAIVAANKVLAPLTLHEAVKSEVLNNVLRDIPLKEGVFDSDKFTVLVNTEAKRLGALASQLQGGGRPFGLGATEPVENDPLKIEAANRLREAQLKNLREAETSVFGSLMGQPKAAEFAVSKGVAA